MKKSEVWSVSANLVVGGLVRAPFTSEAAHDCYSATNDRTSFTFWKTYHVPVQYHI